MDFSFLIGIETIGATIASLMMLSKSDNRKICGAGLFIICSICYAISVGPY